MLPADLTDRKSIDTGGNCFDHITRLNKCLLWSPPLFTTSLMFEELLSCFVVFMVEIKLLVEDGGSPQICADGFARSSERRIQLPRFRPTSMSLS